MFLCRQYKAWQSKEIYVHKEAETPLDDLFIVALQFIQREYVIEQRGKRYFHVYFPQYTSNDHVIDVKFGAR